MRGVRNVGEKAARPSARGGVDGVALPIGEFLGGIQPIDLSNCAISICGLKFDIDAIFRTDIIPRGCEVRQAWQTRISVPNAKGSESAGCCVSSVVSADQGVWD